MIQILSNWARLDQAAAGEWLEGIPAGDLKTAMACEFILTMASVNPDKAGTYLPLIPDGESKEMTIKRINEVLEFYSGDVKERLSDNIRRKLDPAEQKIPFNPENNCPHPGVLRCSLM